MHAFRLDFVSIEDAGLPAQSLPNLIGPPSQAIIPPLPLAVIAQPMALSACEDDATAKRCHPAPAATRQATKPCSPVAESARCPFEKDRIVELLPVLTVIASAAVERDPILADTNHQLALNGGGPTRTHQINTPGGSSKVLSASVISTAVNLAPTGSVQQTGNDFSRMSGFRLL